MRRLTVLTVMVLAAAAACEFTAPERLGDPATIRMVSGDGQWQVGGSTLTEPLVVAAESRVAGVPRAGESVEWTLISPYGGGLSAAETTTDSTGRTSVTAALPNFEGASMRVVATLEGAGDSVVFEAGVTGTETGADSLMKVGGDDQRGVAGTPLEAPYVVKVVNEARAGVEGAEVRFWLREGGGSLSTSTDTSDADGEAAVTPTLPDEALTTQVVGATVVSLRDSVTFSSRTFGAATSIEPASGEEQSGVGGRQLDEPLVAVVTDAEGNRLEGREVAWEVTSAEGGSLSAAETTTDSAGRTSVTATLPNLEGASMTAEATLSDTLAPAVYTASVTRTRSGADSLQKVSGDDQSGPAGSELDDPYVVKVLDRAGSGVSGAEVLFWIESGGGSLDARSVTTDASGDAAVTATLPDSRDVTQVVGATMASLRDTLLFASRSTGGTGGPADIQIVSGNDQKGIVRDTLLDPLVVEVTNSRGALLAGVSVKWKITTDQGGSLRHGSTRTDSGGIATNRWRLGDRPGNTDRLIAWIEPSNAADRDTVSFRADVTGVPDTIVIKQGAIELDNNATPEPDTVIGDTVTVAPNHWSREAFRARVEDAAGRHVRGALVTWAVTSGGGTVGMEPEGAGAETIRFTTDADGRVRVWRRAPADTAVSGPGDWIGATLSVDEFPDVPPMTLDALIRR